MVGCPDSHATLSVFSDTLFVNLPFGARCEERSSSVRVKAYL
jgi:hypothetical protein